MEKPTEEHERQNTKPIRTLVRGAYDLQKLRISTGNRVVGNFRAKLGQSPGTKASDSLSEEAKQILVDLKRRHRRITDALIAADHDGPFVGDELISTYTEFALVSEYLELEGVEVQHFKRLETALQEIPIYVDFLSGVRGIAAAMGGVIVSEFDIHKATYPSSLWAYAGLDVAGDGLGRSKRREHLVKRQYVNKAGKEDERDSITYNAWLKTKLMGVLGPSFLRTESPYAAFYYQYRHRIETDPAREIVTKPGFHKDATWTKMRRHEAATRYMVKIFLIDLYKRWRLLEGLPVHPPYSEAKQGHVHRERPNQPSHPISSSEPSGPSHPKEFSAPLLGK
jgi:hypothetical protein